MISEIDWYSIGFGVGSFILGASAGWSPKIMKLFKRKKTIVDSLSDSMEMHLRMQDLVTDLRRDYDSSRAFIYIFHNGGYFLNGDSIKKMSCIYESVKKGVSYEAMNGQSLSTTIAPLIMQSVTNEPKFFIVKEMQESTDKHLLEARNVYASAYVAIKRSAQVIGFVGIHYCNGDTKAFERFKDKDGIFEILQYTSDCAAIELLKANEQKG